MNSSTPTEPKTTLRLSCSPDCEPRPASSASSIVSSIHQTAITLVTVASERASQCASRPSAPTDSLLAALEARTADTVQRANAEQARRFAECTLAAFDAMLRHMIQPYFALDEMGRVVRWNAAMTDWSGIAEDGAPDRALSTIFLPEAAAEIEASNLALREAEQMSIGVASDAVFVLDGTFALNNGSRAVRVSLLPLCRQPHIVDTVLVLVTPVHDYTTRDDSSPSPRPYA